MRKNHNVPPFPKGSLSDHIKKNKLFVTGGEMKGR